MAGPSRGTRRGWSPCTIYLFISVFVVVFDVVCLTKVRAENELPTPTAASQTRNHVGANNETTSNNGVSVEGTGLNFNRVLLSSSDIVNVSTLNELKSLNLLPAILGSRIALVDSSFYDNKDNETNGSTAQRTNGNIDKNSKLTSVIQNVTFIDVLPPPKHASAFITYTNDTSNYTKNQVNSDAPSEARVRVALPTLFYEDVRAKHGFLKINSPTTTPTENGDAGEKNNNDGETGLEEHDKNVLPRGAETGRGGEARGVTAVKNGRREAWKEGDTVLQESRSTEFSAGFISRVEEKTESKKNDSMGKLEEGGKRNSRSAVVGREGSVVQLDDVIIRAAAAGVLSAAPDRLPLGDDDGNKGSSDSSNVAGAWTGREEAKETVFELTNREQTKPVGNNSSPASQFDVNSKEKKDKLEKIKSQLKKQGSLVKWSWKEQKLKQAALNQNGKSNLDQPQVEVGLGGVEGWLPSPEHSNKNFHQPDLYSASHGRPAAVRVGYDNGRLKLKMEVKERGSLTGVSQSMSSALPINNNKNSHVSGGDELKVELLQGHYKNHDIVRRDADVVTVKSVSMSVSSSSISDSLASASEKRSIDVADPSGQLTDRMSHSNPKMKIPLTVSLLHQGSLGVLPNRDQVTESDSIIGIEDRRSPQVRDPRRHQELHFNGPTEDGRNGGFMGRIPDGSNFAIEKRRQHQLDHSNRVPNRFSGAMLGFNQGPRPFDQRDPLILFDLDVPPIVAQMPEKFIPNFNSPRPHQINIVHRPHPPVVEVQHFPPLPVMHHFPSQTPNRGRPTPFRENHTPTTHFREPNRPSSTPRPMQSHVIPNFRRPFNTSTEGRVMHRPVLVDQVRSPDLHIRIPTSVGHTQVDGPWTFFDDMPMKTHGPLEEMEISPPLFHTSFPNSAAIRPSATSTPPPHRELFRPTFHPTEVTPSHDFRDDFRHEDRQKPMRHGPSPRPILHDQVFLQDESDHSTNFQDQVHTFDHNTKEHAIRIHIENGEPTNIRRPPPNFHNTFEDNRHHHTSTLRPNQQSTHNSGVHHSSTSSPHHHVNQNNNFETNGVHHSSTINSNQNNHFGDNGHHQSTTHRPFQHPSHLNNQHVPSTRRPTNHHMTTMRPPQSSNRPSIEIITRLPVSTSSQNKPHGPAHVPHEERWPVNNRPVPIEIEIFPDKPPTPRPPNNSFRPTERPHHTPKPDFRPQKFDNHQSNFHHEMSSTTERPWHQNSDINEGFNSDTMPSRPTTNRFPDHTRPFQNFKPNQKRPNIEIPNQFQSSTRPSKFQSSTRPSNDFSPNWENTQITQHFPHATRPPPTRPTQRPNIQILHNDQDDLRPNFSTEPTGNSHWSQTTLFRPSSETFRPTTHPSTPPHQSHQSNRPEFHFPERPSSRPHRPQQVFIENSNNNEQFNSHTNFFNSHNNNHNNNFHSTNNFNQDATSTIPPHGFSRPTASHHPSFNENHDPDEGFTVAPDPAVIPPRPPFLPAKPDPMYVGLEEDNNDQQRAQPTLHITPRPPFTTPVTTNTVGNFHHTEGDHQFTTPSPTASRPQQERPATNFRDFKTSKGANRNTFSITTSRPFKTSLNNFENHFIKTTKNEEHKTSPTSALFDITTHSTPVLRTKPKSTTTPHSFPTFHDDQQRVPIPKFLTPLVKFRDSPATENSLIPNSAVQITPKAVATPEFSSTRFPQSFSTVPHKFSTSTFRPVKNQGKFKDEEDYDTLFTPITQKPQVVHITTPAANANIRGSSQSTSRRPSSLPNDIGFSTLPNESHFDDDFDEYEDFHDEQDEYEQERIPTIPTSNGNFISNSVSSTTPFSTSGSTFTTGGHPSLLGFPSSLSPPHKPSLKPLTKPPIGSSKPQRPLTTSSPSGDFTAFPCDHDACQLPNCFCGGNNRIPGDLGANEVPQLVMLTFDDDVNEVNWALYKKLLYAGRQNPNGCPISTTFYVSHEWTDYSKVQTLYADGHEIASHSISHPDGARFSKRRWEEEIYGQKQILSHMGNVPLRDIKGMRAPFLAVGGNKMFGMLHDTNFTYDSSLPVPIHDPPYWPYTLDYALGHDCMIPPCPRNSYPSLWELPMVMWVDLKGGRCSMADACTWGDTKEKVTANLMKNFQRHYTSNRAPFNLFFHSAWFDKPQNMEGFQLFLDKVLALPDVYFVTASQVIEWMRQPTSLREIHSFVPFSCHLRSQNVGACKKPHECQLRFKGGETRYVRTCQECPAVYPWINNPYGLSNAKKTT